MEFCVSRASRVSTRVLQLRQLVAQGAHIGLHGRRGLLPVLRRKGKRPDGVGEAQTAVP